MADVALEGIALGPSAARARSRAALWRRRTWRWFVSANKVSHRWIALVLGVLLLLETTSGAVLLYETQIDGWTSHGYVATPSKHPITLARAITVVAKKYPKFHPDYVGLDANGDAYGVYQVSGKPNYNVMVDPGTGHILGTQSTQENSVLRFIENLHECAFTCKDDPGYLAPLNHPFPGAGTVGLKGVTYADFILGVLGLMLVYLCVSGLVLWWPGVKRFFRSFTMKVTGGRYRRDRDLHRVIGLAVLPFLLMWAATGADFELPFVGKTLFAAQGVVGFPSHAPPSPSAASKKSNAPRITFAQAEQAALRRSPGAKITAYSPPSGPKGPYTIDMIRGANGWTYDPGSTWNYQVSVDIHDANRTWVTYTNPTASPAGFFFAGFGATIHYGDVVNPWVRIIWFVAGMSPLLLAITGISTWLVRRTRRKRAKAAGISGSDMDDELNDLDDPLAAAPL